MPIDRASWRNVWLYEASTGNLLGGAHQNGSMTEANLLSILEGVLLVVDDQWSVKHRSSGLAIGSMNAPLQPGEYEIYCQSSIRVNNEPWVARLISHSISGRVDAFRDGVRARDGKCVVSGIVNVRAPWNTWSGFEAAHVFPLDCESVWIEFNYGRWITDMDGTTGVSRINSIQNGLLLRGDLHSDFDNYLFSINPDDGYKITFFGPDPFGLDGRTLDPVCRNPQDPHCVSDTLLRWHFRQAVLANMRGAGEPIFEHDFPPGTDMLAELRSEPEPYGKQRFEMEMSSRLRNGAPKST
ncbi:hypothetical protein CPC735_035660 [Coccidioides posadasii C735 delta SOWgp]|uniref:Uncharacterized protein n=1 Tax=Coccidioides posadasii (strain C735) TaxID=222929 RepID=C5P1V7_COCP7|nr:hypothetical protein CPC735_035660 [Coccidioides posadasii C735 delta SOWgp]EER28860.1 hypothetical protein CPC735_035660 [Coccidioides posadasii C735 delta SOWgp]|eukprot:XP_003071005.1 hypothetical protein CPC735_035660 [Coccidioides posadasii C735 delta SOWgp]